MSWPEKLLVVRDDFLLLRLLMSWSEELLLVYVELRLEFTLLFIALVEHDLLLVMSCVAGCFYVELHLLRIEKQLVVCFHLLHLLLHLKEQLVVSVRDPNVLRFL